MLPVLAAILCCASLLVCCTAVFVWFVLGALCIARRSSWKHAKVLPGPDERIPLLWLLRQDYRQRKLGPMVPYNAAAMETHIGLFHQFRNEGFYRFYLGNQLMIMVFRTELAESLLTSQETMEKAISYKLLHSWLGTGLLISSGAKWKQRRRMLTPAFHFRILENFVAPMNEHARNMVKKISQATRNEEATDICPFSTACALEVLLETIMGVIIEEENADIRSYVEAIKYLTAQIIVRSLSPWLYNDSIYLKTSAGRQYKHSVSVVHSFNKKVIENRREELIRERNVAPTVSTNGDESQKKRLLTFIDILLQHSLDFDALLTDDDIREEVDTFMFEGHDTTGTAIAWCLYLIGLHLEVQKKLREELEEILGGESERNLTIEHLKKLKYMDCVIKECQRLYPSVPIIGRTATQEFNLGGNLIPKGTNFALFLYGLHRDPDVFQKPEEFDPDRFLPENVSTRHPFSFIPFAAGSRNCIGQKFASMEIKIVLSHVLRSFTLQSTEHRDKIMLSLDLVMRAAGGLRIKFIPRMS